VTTRRNVLYMLDDFNGDGRVEVICYTSRDRNWWLGTFEAGGTLRWTDAGNVNNFGNLLDGQHLIMTGDFDGDRRAEVLFYFKGDGNWFIGVPDANNRLDWSGGPASNTKNKFPGILWGWYGDFDADGRTDWLWYSIKDRNWWLLTLEPNTKKLKWTIVGNTFGFGSLSDGQHPMFKGDFDADDHTDILMHHCVDGAWWLGTLDEYKQLNWELVGDTRSQGATNHFGDLCDGRHTIRSGIFYRVDIIFYFERDGNWWLGSLDRTTRRLSWKNIDNTRNRFGRLLKYWTIFLA
jgi:hypothetical protein